MPAEVTRPVRRELFRAAGTPDSEAVLEQSLDPLRVGLGERRLRVAENAVLVPNAGILDRDGNTLPDGQFRRFPSHTVIAGEERIEPIEPEVELSGEAVYLGWFGAHFGHFLIETMARWWAVRHVDVAIPLIWQSSPPFLTSRFAHRRVSGFGFDQARISLVEQPMRVQRLILPDVTFEERYYIHEDAAIPFHEIGEQLGGFPDLTDQPLYLSRGNIKFPGRVVENEVRFEEYLTGQGWRVVRPDALPIPEQIALVRSHRVIAGHIGTALHLTMFSAHRPIVHALTYNTNALPNYALWADALGTPFSSFNCAAVNTTGDPALKNVLSFDLAKAAGYLHAEGLVASPRVPGFDDAESAPAPDAPPAGAA
jgi:capsular polysaccharide biosynthesis protein